MAIINGVGPVGIRNYVPPTQLTSTLLTSLFGAWNADTTTTTLATGAYGAWNAEGVVTATQLTTSTYGAWNAEALGTTLDANIFRVYNGDNVNDSSGNAQNGTNVGSVTFTTGKVGNAFTFNGSNYINLPSASLNSLTGDFSVSFWMNLAGVGADAQFPVGAFYYDGTNLYGWDCYIQSSNLNFQIFNGTSNATINTLTTGVGPYYGTWAFFTLVRKGSTSSKIYINGNLVASNTNTTNPVHHASSSATIGARKFDSTIQYNMVNGGKLDAVTIWNKTLTDNDVLSLYNNGTGVEYPYSTKTLPSANDVIGTNNGTLMNGCAFTTGKIGNAFSFDGVNDYVALPTNILKKNNDFSFSLWVNPSALSGNQAIFGTYFYDGTTTYGWRLDFVNSSMNFGIFGSSQVNLGIGGTFNNGQWYHITVTRKASTGTKVYINGTLNVSNTSTINPNYATTQYTTIGATQYQPSTVTYYFNGKIDAVNTWDKELSSDEVLGLYNGGSGNQYPFSTITVSTPKDSVSTNNGTIVGGVTYTTGVVGNAFQFDGSTGYVSLPANSLNFTGDFSISLWYYVKVVNDQALISNRQVSGGNNYGWQLYYNSGWLYFYMFNGTSTYSTAGFDAGSVFAANNWAHISVVRKAGTSTKFYINGVLINSGQSSGVVTIDPVYTANQICAIGNVWTGSILDSYVKSGAKIDAATTWTKALTQDEITQLYNMGGGIQYPFTTQTIKTPYSVYNGDSLVDPIGAKNATINGSVTYTTGKIGNAYNFNGSSSLNLPVGAMSFQGTSFSFSMWLNFNGTPGNYATILSNCIMANYKGFIFGNNGGGLYFQLGNGTSTWITLGGPAVSNFVNNWGLVTLVWEQGVGAKIYMNGVLYSSVANTTTPDFSTITANPVVGVGNGGSGWPALNGKIDGLTFWNSALTYPEVSALYNDGNGMEYPYSSITAKLPSASDVYGTNNGTLMNGCTFTTGKIGKAFIFDGVNDHVALPTNTLRFTGDFSCSLWVYIPTNSSTNQTLIGCLRQPSIWKGWDINIYQNRIYFEAADASSLKSYAYINNSNIGAWKHIVGTFKNGTGGKLYIDGTLQGSFAMTAPIVYDSTDTPTIGCMSYGAGLTWFAQNGIKMDAISTWTKELSSTEVTDLYNSGNGKQYPNY